MDYYTMERFTRTFDLVRNRVDICNEILECRLPSCSDNPVRLLPRVGYYDILVCDCDFASIKLWDEKSANDALAQIDSLANGLWLLRRGKAFAIV